ncbi:HAMP domain-containing methyl-accepting chemotaxis protein [Dolichospermum circinale CS-537/01]|uniref:HAMP domain-containing methyl-accepting chemotaxis protein n=1 Tax=Dolichospermum circinale CS-537/01 TaxID=3021739 RepID=A0ABT5A414_9CYAN|nr:HAMP domain-containing methyl-accepting chemotaxis protein [Dolichospermum circinale]MDB9486659.1 HAMP domain-containing methyl-accepting chemotaxis protein [Dolichospermum circinale CS-537/01]
MAKPTDDQDSTFNQDKIASQQQVFEDDAKDAFCYEPLISEEESSDSSQLNSFAEYELALDSLENPFLAYSEIIDTTSSELDSNSLEQLRDRSDDPFALIPEDLTSNPISYRSSSANESSIISDDDDSYSPFAAPKFSATDQIFIGDDLEDFYSNQEDNSKRVLLTDNDSDIVPKQEFNLNYMTTPPRLSLGKNNDNQFDLEAFIAAFDDENEANMTDKTLISGGEIHNDREVLNDLDEVDNLSDISVFEFIGDSSDELMKMPSESLDSSENVLNIDESLADERIYNDQELLTISAAQEVIPVDITSPEVTIKEANIGPEKNLFASFENASLNKKQLWIAGTVGVVSVIAVVIVSALGSLTTPVKQKESMSNTNWFMPLLIPLTAGATGAATSWFMTNFMVKKISRSTQDLQSQFHAMGQGNLNVAAKVYSKDELGHLATDFNKMVRSLVAKTERDARLTIAQKETKDNLQSQVIRLLDEVEGAAKGDLTVRAEVTDEGLGPVADAFNLIIQNLRDIVQQVKVSAHEVTKAAGTSETFASNLSMEALGQAKELALALNSVQIMNNSIQRVAEAAKEAEIVACEASKIAQKGGEVVENTVFGILELRETVAETSRKVKRLGESSQEINSIVALVSQIASRTNLLALNASIEAARAGEAGRGFAIVADEVRQLADKSAKSLQEIEQIVMQIQSETSSVMMAMEEGTQQVINQTRLAQESKQSLDNIIEVANHIDMLVRSITNDTGEQRETYRNVAQVMQSVERTAQETSQEAQRAAAALQYLVGVSRNLIISVERFRVESTPESQRLDGGI